MITNHNALAVFDSLEVGPLNLEKRRVSAAYRLRGRGIDDSIDLIYRFEEDVFNPDDFASQNMAAMLVAQVALNYGLFCRKIILNDIYDGADRRFLYDMAENTAREILVKKLLEKNPLLTSDIKLSPVKLKKYLNAEIIFPKPFQEKLSWRHADTNRDQYAILSSGGKDSLLTHGLITELGKEAHPFFVNESGRHWFTALNAYRHFQAYVPNTSRVWVNSDRVFNWMLRHMPFIRGNFSSIRSDEYPIRLWTVAVFLFGVLPLVRKRNIGRILIGDEYDTTRRKHFEGILHYDGLYDQSFYFDNALSRYFLIKGWAISQFSILRPLSELLIQKMLVERYPQLQAQQVSCHAAHKEGERLLPCGRCEKCRRIVGMLTALDADPTRCGYTKDQIHSCLKNLKKDGVHQYGTDAEHLYALLFEKGVFTEMPGANITPKRHDEVMRLRFDNEHSPVNIIPEDLKLPLYERMLSHASGAVIRKNRIWQIYDPLTDIPEEARFAFDITSRYANRQPAENFPSTQCLWGHLTWPEAEDKFKIVDIALLPVGSVEQHGPHLPLDTDAFDADYLARRVAEACSDPKPLVLPLMPYGFSNEHESFAGTVSISNDTLAALVYEIGLSVARNGIKKLVIINGHGGNIPALNFAAQNITRDSKLFVCVDSGDSSDIDISHLTETPNDVHAGEIETSTSLAVRPHLVKMDKAKKNIPRFASRYLNYSSKRYVYWSVNTEKISKSGVLGDPEKASVEKGEKIWNIMVAHLVSLVEDLKNMSLEQIYKRK